MEQDHKRRFNMGWCSGTVIFDAVCKVLLSDKPIDKKETVKHLARVLEDGDWDCQNESEYFHYPIVEGVMRELHPDWFEDDED